MDRDVQRVKSPRHDTCRGPSSPVRTHGGRCLSHRPPRASVEEFSGKTLREMDNLDTARLCIPRIAEHGSSPVLNGSHLFWCDTSLRVGSIPYHLWISTVNFKERRGRK